MKKSTGKLAQKGTSLIEVILYIALFSIIIIVVVDLLITSGSLKTESESQSGLQSDAALISSRLTFLIRNADTIVTPSVIGQTTTTLVLTNGAETHTFNLLGNKLSNQKKIGATTTTANLNTNLTAVSNLSFQDIGNVGGKQSLKIGFTLNEVKPTQQGSLSKIYQVVATQR